VPDHAELFAELEREAPWRQRTRRRWDAEVLEPRRVAGYDSSLPASLEQLRAAVSQRYGVVFGSCLVNLYRTGPTRSPGTATRFGTSYGTRSS